MTIIITLVNKFGIVHGGDSAISHVNALGENETTQDTKIFRLGPKAAVSVAGNWFIDNEFMDSWMPEFIAQQLSMEGFTLRSFAKNLQDEWHAKIPEGRRAPLGNWAHVCGVESTNQRSHAEFWAVSNIRDQNLIGPTNIDLSRFHHWEDFSTRDCRLRGNVRIDLYMLFSEGWPHGHVYFNGHGHGRLLTQTILRLKELRENLGPVLRTFLTRANLQPSETELEVQEARLESIISSTRSRSAPSSLQETEDLVRNSVRLICEAFELTRDSAIGGEVQIESIAFDEDLIRKCTQAPLYTPHVIDNGLPAIFESAD